MIDVLIVGAGPAGLSAAAACAQNGLRVRIVDEFMKPGGRLLGQLHQEPDGVWWNGVEEAARLFAQVTELGVEVELGTSVYDIQQTTNGWQVYTSSDICETSALLLATGAAEMPSPIPGWTLPGVMSIGAAQIMTNVHRVKAGKSGIIIGINVLSAAIARELQLAGIHIAAMTLPGRSAANRESSDPQKVMESMLRVIHLAPSPIIRQAGKWMKYPFLQKWGLQLFPRNGVKMWGIPVQLRKAIVEICGDQQVESVRVARLSPTGEIMPNSMETIPVDFVCIAGGLYPLAELAAVAGCPFRYIPELGGHVPLHNEYMQTPLKGLYVAGNITGIESAKVAMAQGTVAGISIAAEYSKADSLLEEKLQSAIDNVNLTRNEASIQFHPDVRQGRRRMETMYRAYENADTSSS